MLFFIILTSTFLMTRCTHNVTAGCRPLDVVFLIDSSGSENNDSFNAQLEFMKELVQSSISYNNDTKFGAVSFSNEAKLEFNLNQYASSADVIRAIENITHIGKFTHIEEGFKYVTNASFTNTSGDRPDADNVLLVLTDGIFHPENASEPAEILLGDGVKISLVLFTNRVTDKLNNNAQSVTDLNNTFTKDTFEPINFFCPDTSSSNPISTPFISTPPSETTPHTANLGCRDKVAKCASYGAEICSQYKSWAEIQCRCFCKFDEVTISGNTTRDPKTEATVPTNPKVWVTITNKH
ncbi:cartilage matrix protein-like [Saccostrea echinata]|uniref:cartilage matrix protein-like n=1 Tax=Saccostrea echinata TaxID=191078 RepID=UPI002A8046C4|nr:cartilage matrix protein-like [Saccostrea echinata]